MSLLMDALRKAEKAKQPVRAHGSAQLSVQYGLGTHASLLSSSLPSSSIPNTSLSKEDKDSLKEVSGNHQQFSQIRQVQQKKPSKSARRANNRNGYIVISSGCGAFFLLVFGAYTYYQSISNSLQKNISDAVSPILNQQRQQIIKSAGIDSKSSAQLSELLSTPLSSKESPQINRSASKSSIQTSGLRPKQPAAKQLVTPPTKRVTKKSVPVPAAPNNAAPITIKRQFVADNVYQLLTSAYQAYQVGNDKEALSYYRNVLEIENNNRDAMLGLAAISVRRNQFEKARDTYIALLENDPKNSIALSALINIQSNVDPVKSESKIKLLLHNEPDSSHLLFTLGSLYVSQQRWAEAQKVFFKAYRSDNQNADLAYNLAVSLDQLAQRKTALKFYRTALELLEQQPISFNVNDVMQRINVLQEVRG